MRAHKKIHSEEEPPLTDEDLKDPIISIYGRIDAKARICIARQFEQDAAALYESAFKMDPSLKRPPAPASIPKSFFLVNMSESDRIEARKYAKQCCINLRTAVGWAIREMIAGLKVEARFAQLTGMGIPEQRPFLGFKCRDN